MICSTEPRERLLLLWNHRVSGIILALLATSLYAMKGIFVKFIYGLGVDTISVMALRTVISFPIYLLIGLWSFKKLTSTQSSQIRHAWLPCVSIGIFGYYFATLFDLIGLNYISAQLSGLVSFTYPTFVILLNRCLFKVPISKPLVFTLLLTYCGIFTLFSHELLLEGKGVILGVTLGLASAFCFAGYMLFSKAVMAKISSGLFTSIAMSAASLLILIHFIAAGKWMTLFITPQVAILSFCMALGCTIAPSYMLGEAITRIGANKTAVLGGFGPVMTASMAILVLNEGFTYAHLLGMLLVTLAITLEPVCLCVRDKVAEAEKDR